MVKGLRFAAALRALFLGPRLDHIGKHPVRVLSLLVSKKKNKFP